jgi:hypothetical protein
MPNWCNNNLTLSHDDPAMIQRAFDALERQEFLQEFCPVPNRRCVTLLLMVQPTSNWLQSMATATGMTTASTSGAPSGTAVSRAPQTYTQMAGCYTPSSTQRGPSDWCLRETRSLGLQCRRTVLRRWYGFCRHLQRWQLR